MAIPSKQIGWGTEEKLLWQIAKQLETLTKVIYNIGQAPANTNCIEFVADTTLYNQLIFGMRIGVSADITYTATWGDGTTSNGTIVAGDPVEITHEYTGQNTAYNVQMCFSDATKVTYLEFYAAD